MFFLSVFLVVLRERFSFKMSGFPGVSWDLEGGFPGVSEGFRGFPAEDMHRPALPRSRKTYTLSRQGCGFPPELLNPFIILKAENRPNARRDVETARPAMGLLEFYGRWLGRFWVARASMFSSGGDRSNVGLVGVLEGRDGRSSLRTRDGGNE
jgi:hypothetical protein